MDLDEPKILLLDTYLILYSELMYYCSVNSNNCYTK